MHTPLRLDPVQKVGSRPSGKTRKSRGCFNAIIRIQIRRMLLLSGAGWCVVIVAGIITVRCVAVGCITTVETTIVCVTSVAVTRIDCTRHYAWVVAVVVGVHHFSTTSARGRACVCAGAGTIGVSVSGLTNLSTENASRKTKLKPMYL